MSKERTVAALVFMKPERLRARYSSAHAQAGDPKIMSATSVVMGIDVAKASTLSPVVDVDRHFVDELRPLHRAHRPR